MRFRDRAHGLVTVLAASTIPTDLSGLQWWLEADRLAGADGASVTSWTDLSGAGNHFVTGTSPTKETNEINGLPVVRFNGVDDYLKATNDLTLANFTLVMVVKIPAYDGATYNNRALFSWGPNAISSTPGGGALLLNHDTGGVDFYAGSASDDAELASVVAPGSHVLLLTGTATAVALYIDGVLAASDVTANANWVMTETYLGAYVLDVASAALFAGVDIAMAALYNVVLSAGSRANLTASLGSKYGITVA